jgi:carboxy-cis,cis-muconate cyclase
MARYYTLSLSIVSSLGPFLNPRNSVFCQANFVDAYHIHETSLVYISSRPLLPPILSATLPTTSSSDPHTRSHFRGDTLMLSPSTSQNPAPCALLATTRGSTGNIRGWLSIFRLGPSGEFLDDFVRFETPTSGGKANALDVRAKEDSDGGMWILLTDDDDQAASGEGGGVRVLEWDGWGKGNVSVVAEWPPQNDASQGETMLGGSHAIWLD